MNRSRFSFSLAVTSSIALAAIILSAPANAQLYSRGGRTGSNAVANHGDSIPTVASSGGPSTSDSSVSAPAAKSMASSSGEKGSGLSGKVFARFVMPEDWISIASIPGASLATASVQSAPSPSSETVFTMRSFGQKVRQWLNGYRLGYWPEEKGRVRSEAYKNPDGFIEVTPDNEDTRVSEHFRLRDFVSHDQKDVWPKYVVLREPLLDKLELVIEDLNDHGINAEGLRIRSGFRTPAHNFAVRGEGSARDSRHQFGDAADVYIDQEGNGKMSDLNGDGKVSFADVKLILDAVERVEARYPELVGGTGLYAYSGASGPFAHIDVRGTRARWVRGVYKGRSRRVVRSHKATSKASKVIPASTKSASASRGQTSTQPQ
ncbi:MAG TPA: D-Ala-D-Ala carboxypeptidase family metallohydrolase [Gemmatimonadaceae bacterium]|nr:D-Ala-D-Ala carboxypeptidase family metallohydrolase [Gemmatimonadaceae bacterium]